MTALVNYTHPSTVNIIDGKISFLIPIYDLVVTVNVKQTKGMGTADADLLVEINHWHKQILDSMIKRSNYRTFWEANEILRACKFDIHNIEPNKEFKEANWRRPISELLRKGILIKSRSGKNYALDIAKAELALWTGKFEN